MNNLYFRVVKKVPSDSIYLNSFYFPEFKFGIRLFGKNRAVYLSTSFGIFMCQNKVSLTEIIDEFSSRFLVI